MKSKFKLKKNDKVIVKSGKDKGKVGKILRINPETGRILVSGVNMLKKAVRPSRDMPSGGIIEQEGSMHMSNVRLQCSKCGKGVRIGIKKLPDGTKMRYCKKCEVEV